MSIQVISSDVRSKHWMQTPLPGSDLFLFMFSGIALFHGDNAIKGESSDAWARRTAKIFADFKNVIPTDHAILASFWVLDVHPASIYNDGHAVNTGWAVEGFGLPRSAGSRELVRHGSLSIEADVAVHDRDAYLFRLSFSTTIVGRIIELPPIIVE